MDAMPAGSIVLELKASPSGNMGSLTIALPPIMASSNLTMQPNGLVQQFFASVGQTLTIGYNGPQAGLGAPVPYPANAPAGTPVPTNPAWANSFPSIGLLTPINGGLQATYKALSAGSDAISCVLTYNGEISVMLADMVVS